MKCSWFALSYLDTPKRVFLLQGVTWILCAVGIFFVMASHEHYTVDVFMAIYITSRMFLYYHSMANNRTLHLPGSCVTRIWFPMFSYFEAQIDGIVPNEYTNPLCKSNLVYVWETLNLTVRRVLLRLGLVKTRWFSSRH